MTGRIDALFRYPVKSMLGEELDSTGIGDRGLFGDRAYALVDEETGKVVSAKNPRRWSVLFQCRAEYIDEPSAGSESESSTVRITLPDGSTVDSDDPGVHDALSRVVDRAVRLESKPPARAVIETLSPIIEGVPEAQSESMADGDLGVVAPGTFFDAAPLHVVTTATLEWLRELAPQSSFPAQRFRPNVVVVPDTGAGFVENTWVSRSLHLGPEVQASVFIAAPRCVMTTLAQPDLPRDPGVLQAIARHNRFDIPGLGPSSCVGVYALVTAGGTMRRGDPVVIEPS